jgi:hypothetical protein
LRPTPVILAALFLGTLTATLPTAIRAQDAAPVRSAAEKFDAARAALAPEFGRMYRATVDGSNPVLAVVDGKPITFESVRSELTDFDTRVQTEQTLSGDLSRQQAEDLVVYRAVRQRAGEIIIQREADTAGFKVSDSVVEANVSFERERAGIDRDDLSKWAEYTQQNYGKSPLQYRKYVRDGLARSQILKVMAGQYGPIRGYKLPVFYELSVSPQELRDEYERDRERWRVLLNIDYSLFSVQIASNTAASARNSVENALTEAKKRLANESEDAVTEYLKQELARVPGLIADVVVKKHVTAADDSKLDSYGENVRKLIPAQCSEGVLPGTEGEKSVLYFVRLNSREIGPDKRVFTDVAVQEGLRQRISRRKLGENLQRVQDALIERAIIVPGSVRGR